MTHKQVIAEVARRLPHRTRRDVNEIIDVLTEIWARELQDEQSICIPKIGRLSIEIQDMKAGGILSQHHRLARVYGRFRPTQNLKNDLRGKYDKA